MEEEIWKDVEGYENHYQVSNLGRVRTIDYVKESNGKSWMQRGKILKPHDAGKGYLQVFLYNKGKRTMFEVHRLVAKAFIPNPNNLPEVNHKDENGHNNEVSNLEWCTPKYNSNYGTRGKRISQKITGRGGIRVIAVDGEGRIVAEFPSICNASKAFGVTHAPMQRCVEMNKINPIHTIKGYVIRIKDEK